MGLLLHNASPLLNPPHNPPHMLNTTLPAPDSCLDRMSVEASGVELLLLTAGPLHSPPQPPLTALAPPAPLLPEQDVSGGIRGGAAAADGRTSAAGAQGHGMGAAAPCAWTESDKDCAAACAGVSGAGELEGWRRMVRGEGLKDCAAVCAGASAAGDQRQQGQKVTRVQYTCILLHKAPHTCRRTCPGTTQARPRRAAPRAAAVRGRTARRRLARTAALPGSEGAYAGTAAAAVQPPAAGPLGVGFGVLPHLVNAASTCDPSR